MINFMILFFLKNYLGMLFTPEEIAMAKQHEKQQLRNEDAMMAAHLQNEGFTVFPPRN